MRRLTMPCSCCQISWAADAFVSGADRAVLAGAVVVVAGLVMAFRAFRPERASDSAVVPAEALVLEATSR